MGRVLSVPRNHPISLASHADKQGVSRSGASLSPIGPVF